MQKKNLFFLSVAVIALTSCSGKLGTLSADNFTVNPNPLETQEGNVPVTINGTFPEKFMAKKAVVTVTPELRYNGQVTKGQSATFQGEKVLGNDQTINYKVGGNYTMKSNFKYVPDMQKSDLYLTFDAKIGNKSVSVPAIKVGEGVIATSELYHQTLSSAAPSVSTDAFQRTIAQKQEANIQFLIQQATVRQSELKTNSIQEFVKMLNSIAQDQKGLKLDNIEVSAYASPDGGFSLNEKLAGQRQQAASKYLAQQMKKANVDSPVDTKYTAEDWDGFQQLVAASNIQDKDVILRVLSMYQDPEEREAQIKNMSAAFKELADGILPQLRRARMTINYQVVGRSDAEIQAQINEDPSKLTLEELLYGASKMTNQDAKEALYKKISQLYPNDARAFNNVSTIEYAKGNYNAAKEWAEKALKVNSNLAEASANLGMIAMKNGDLATAKNLIAKGSSALNAAEAQGNLYLAQGNYAQAEQARKGINSNSAALAQIMNKNYSAATQTLSKIANPDGTTEYLKALVAARTGKNSDASTALKAAIAKDPTLAKYAQQDLELQKVSK